MLINNHIKIELWSNIATYSTPGSTKSWAIKVERREYQVFGLLGGFKSWL